MYLQLFHGRISPDAQLEDWGLPGPVIGPLKYAHTTYASDLKFGFADNSKSDGWLTVVDGLIYYDRLFYGDWSTFANLSEETRSRIVEFDQTKAKTPTSANTPAVTEDNLANILTALTGFAFLAQENTGDPAKAQKYLQQILSLIHI